MAFTNKQLKDIKIFGSPLKVNGLKLKRILGVDEASNGGTGDIVNGGQVGPVIIGTNDATSLSLETSGVTAFQISSAGLITNTSQVAATNVVSDRLIVQTNSTGTPAANFGGLIRFQGQSSTTVNRDMGGVGVRWTTATDASRSSNLDFYTVNESQAFGSSARLGFINGSNTLRIPFALDDYTTLPVLSLTGMGVSTSNNLGLIGTMGITLVTSSSSGIAIGNSSTSSSNPTLGRGYIRQGHSLTLSSGSNKFGYLDFNSTLSNTGGSTGVSFAIWINPTLTTIADFRAIDIEVNNANAKGVYQSGALTTNRIVGATTFGSVNSPNAAAAVDIVSTTKGFLPPRMTTTEKNAIATPPAGLVVYDTTLNKLCVRTASAWETITSA